MSEEYINMADSEQINLEEDLFNKLVEPKIPEKLKNNPLLTKDLVLANLGYEDYHLLRRYSEVINYFNIFDMDLVTLDMVKNKIEGDALTLVLMSRAKEGTQLKLLRTNVSIVRQETEDLSEYPTPENRNKNFLGRFFK